MYVISKTFGFSAAHSLPDLPEGHKCRRVHGHNYRVTFVLRSPTLDRYGMVHDYSELKDLKEYIDSNLDHRNIDDVVFPSTAEMLAWHLYGEAMKSGYYNLVESVTVQETESTSATYRP